MTKPIAVTNSKQALAVVRRIETTLKGHEHTPFGREVLARAEKWQADLEAMHPVEPTAGRRPPGGSFRRYTS